MRSVISLILVYCLAITSVFAQSVNPNDTLKIGKASSSSDKGLTFDTNDGVSNKKLLIEKISKKLKFDGNTFQIGDGSSSSDKELIIAGALKSLKYNGTSGEFEFNDDVKLSGTLKADFLQAVNTEVAINSLLRASQGIKVGAGANEIRVNAGNLEFSNDGVLYKKLGTGSGGGSTGVNLLANDSFEDGISTGWTSSGGTFSQQTYTNSSEGDTKYARFISSGAGQYIESSAVLISDSMTGGCQADFKKYNTVTANAFKVQAISGASTVLAEQTLAVGSWAKAPAISFACPVAGTSVKLRLISLLAGTIEVDKGYIGSNQNLVQVSATDIGAIIATSSASCPDSTLPADGAAVSRSTYAQLFSKISTTHGVGNGTTTFNVPDYRGRFLRGVDGTAGNDADKASRTAMGSGGNTGNNVGSIQSDNYASHSHGVPIYFGENGTGPFALNIQGYGASGPNGTSSTNSSGGTETRPKNAYVNYCIRYQQVSGEVAVSNEQSSWFIDANIGGENANLGVGAVSSYIDIAAATVDLVLNTSKGSAPAEIPCASGIASSGLTCGGSNESLGIAFIPPSAGLYEACFRFTHSSSSSGNLTTTFQLAETSNTSTAILSEGGQRTQSGASVTNSQGPRIPNLVCGTFNFPDVSKKTIRLMYEQIGSTATSSQISADRDSAQGQRDIHVTVRPLLSAFNRPILTGDQVTTPGSNKPVRYSFNVTPGGVVTRNRGGLISGCAGTAPMICTFVAGKIGALIPNCSIKVDNTGGADRCMYSAETLSNITISQNLCTSNVANFSNSVTVTCDAELP